LNKKYYSELLSEALVKGIFRGLCPLKRRPTIGALFE